MAQEKLVGWKKKLPKHSIS